MKGQIHFLQTTIVGGVLYLIPVVVLVAIAGKAFGIAQQVTAPLAKALGAGTVGGIPLPRLISVLALLLFCFLAGLFSRTKVAHAIVDWIESKVLVNVPGYALLKTMGEGMAGVESTKIQQAVLVRIEDAWQIGFLIERLEAGHIVAYVPGAPNPTSGSIYYLTEDRIRKLDVPPATAMKALRRMGVGSGDMVRGKL